MMLTARHLVSSKAKGRRLLVFGICAGPTEKYETICRPALEWSASGHTIIVLRGQDSIAEAYNAILDSAAKQPGLEGVVLLHDDVELIDEEWYEKLTGAFSTGGDVVGVIGGTGRGGMAWWTRENTLGRVTEPSQVYDRGGGSADVDVLDGLLLGMSPWAVQHLRFAVGVYPGFHGYDADICAQAQALGRRAVIAPIEVVHHTYGAFGTKKSYEDWIRAGIVWENRWRRSTVANSLRNLRLLLLPLEVRTRPSVARRRRGLRN